MPAQSPDVVTDVISDHRRVAWIILRDTRLHFADQVSAHVRALGEQSTTEPGEDGDQRATETETDEVLEYLVLVLPGQQQQPVIARHAEQAEPHHQHAGDGAAAKSHVQGGGNAATGRLGRAQVGAHRDLHAHHPGHAREHCAKQEAQRGEPIQQQPQHQEQHTTNHGDGGILPKQISARPLLHGGGDSHTSSDCRAGRATTQRTVQAP